jgi:N,N'-diacetyllegionaminate synthase
LLLAEQLGATAVKIHPTDFTNLELVRRVGASTIKNVIAGCGGATHSEIEITINELVNTESLTLLHGFQGYPTQLADNCLSRLGFLKSLIDQSSTPIKLGFADHADPESPYSTHLVAASLGYGVSVIEKHLTVAKCLQLEDYESALSPDEFLAFVDIIKHCYEAKSQSLILESSFDLPDSEKAYRQAVSRHVVAKFDLGIHHLVDASDICLKRTASTEFIADPRLVVGKRTSQRIKADAPFTLDTLC